LLGWQDIRQRYRRSVIGPFWLTISTAILVATMGVLYARILNQDLQAYLPYLAVGLIVWGTISSLVSEACTIFISNEHLIKQVSLPLTTHICRLIWRNLLMFGHNAVILIAVVFLFVSVSFWNVVVAILGTVTLFLNAAWITLVVGLVCTRFRDVPPIVNSVMQIAFFLTPILWHPGVLGDRMWIAELNPIYHQIQTIRAPLLGLTAPWLSFAVVCGALCVGFALTLAMLARYRSRLPYWI
jgi:lipopolysaccharide transport system permease protein